MSNKLKKLRKILLGDELYEECKNYAIDKDVLSLRLNEIKKDPKIQKRLNELKITNLCLKDCDVDMLINACNLKSKSDNLGCISNTCKNKIYYDSTKESYYYDIVELNCGFEEDVKKLEYFQKLEDQQKDNFTKFLTLNNDGCFNDDIIYYVAFNKQTETIGGVCQTSDKYSKGIIKVNYITTRAGKVKDDLNKGIGSTILNHIIRKYQSDTDYFGVLLDAVPEAVEFYRKIGFEDASSIKNDKLYTLTHMIYYFIGIDEVKPDTEISDKLFKFGIIYDNIELIKDLLNLGYKVKKSLKRELIDYNLVIEMFHQELNIDYNDFREAIRKRHDNLISSYLSIGMKLDRNLLKILLTDEDIHKKNFYDILNAVTKYQPDILDEELASILLDNVLYKNHLISYNIVKILLDFGAVIEENYINDIEERLETTKKVLDLLKSY